MKGGSLREDTTNNLITTTMKTGKIAVLTIVASLFLGLGLVNAKDNQFTSKEDSLLCIEKFSLYREFYKQKNYDDAMPYWRWVFQNCPERSLNTYIDGANMMKSYVDKSADATVKNHYIDTLMMVYNQRLNYFTTSKNNKPGAVKIRQAMELKNYRPSDTMIIYNLLRQGVELEGVNSDPIGVANYFITTNDLVAGGRFSADSILNAYDYLSDLTDKRLQQIDTNGNYMWNSVKATLEGVFEPYATCDQLVRIYGKKFEATPNDTAMLQKMIRLLDKKKCEQTDLFFAATEQLHKLTPSGNTAYYLGIGYLKRNDNIKAGGYLQEAIPLVEDEKKAKAYYYLAIINFSDNNYRAAVNYANKALQINPNDGRCYMIIGNAYAATASSCGSGEIGSRAGYWAAVDKFYRAKQVDNDPDVVNDANQAISKYSRHFPTTERLFYNEVAKGSSWSINCWYSETTTVRSSD